MVTKQYTYNAVIADDDRDENVEGFILYFEFEESVLNPDDYSRLSQTTAVTLVTIIDNDGCKLMMNFMSLEISYLYSHWFICFAVKLVCEKVYVSNTTLRVSCTASADVEEATCSYDMAPSTSCLDLLTGGKP